MSSLHQYTTSPPPSPWRLRAVEFSARRRPLHFRQILFIVASLTLTFSYIFFVRQSTHSEPTATESLLAIHNVPPPPSEQTAYIQYIDTHLENSVDPSSGPIVFSFIVFSADSANEGAILMKSILMYSSVPIEFHIICDLAAQEYLEKRLNLVTHPTHNVLVRFYHMTIAGMLARIEREGAITTDHSAGVPGLMKLFIHEILPNNVKRAIFIDTDAFFITDPALLWDYFLHLRPTTAISMPTHLEQNAVEWHHANRICSCIMLLDLARLRELRLMDSVAYRNDSSGHFPPALAPPAFEAMFGPPGASGHYEGVKLGDQGYWWAIVSHRPDVFEHLSFEWEVSSCLLDMYFTGLGNDNADVQDELAVQIHTLGTLHQGEAILPKMLHFNCLDGTSRYYEWEGWSDPTNSLTRRWYPAVQYHVGFKWLWLNHHRSESTLRIETVENVIFADERFAAEQSDS
ncbi:predicted protein [Sparassis crispa]|uniref:Glycosyltransferase family 8 protein n=1 Tax=Sparassis crispa TaxID=139825 RepID=A0A401GK80_9APHY|nr:predicted protein [Sparassis crispa]GBE82577.1 predicted protein [Sparassis crispa]